MPSPPSTPRVRAAAAREVQEAKQEADQLAAAQAARTAAEQSVTAAGSAESKNPDDWSTELAKLRVEMQTTIDKGFEQVFDRVRKLSDDRYKKLEDRMTKAGLDTMDEQIQLIDSAALEQAKRTDTIERNLNTPGATSATFGRRCHVRTPAAIPAADYAAIDELQNSQAPSS
jgi:hypothetical protein